MTILEDTRQKPGKHDIKAESFQSAGVGVYRCKLPFGDYAPVPPISIDTKRSIDEIAGNICGAEHARFIRECKAAKDAGCKLIILVENECGIDDISKVHIWQNPRSVYSPKCVQGDRLQRAMETISERYGVEFRFCKPEESGGIIIETLKQYGK